MSTSPGTPTDGTPPPRRVRRRLSSTRVLRRVLTRTGAHYGTGNAPRLRDLLEPLGPEGAALGAALLSLPFLLPVSLGPITSPFSVLIALLAVQLLRRREGAPLPARVLDVSVPQAVHRVMSKVLRRVRRWVHAVSRERMTHLVEGPRGRFLCGAGILAGAVLLAVPVPLLPLTNTFPALSVLLFALGWVERDGLLTVLGSAAVVVSVAVFTGLGVAVALLGWEVVHGAIPFVGA